MDHYEHHLKSRQGMDRMRDLCRHYQHIAFLDKMGDPADRDLRLSLKDDHESIVRSGVFGKSLAFLKSERRNGTGFFIYDHPGNN